MQESFLIFGKYGVAMTFEGEGGGTPYTPSGPNSSVAILRRRIRE